jgi:hypothetical protein
VEAEGKPGGSRLDRLLGRVNSWQKAVCRSGLEVAKAAGISQAYVYRLFPSRASPRCCSESSTHSSAAMPQDRRAQAN